jgi:hypothetical protein
VTIYPKILFLGYVVSLLGNIVTTWLTVGQKKILRVH